MCLPNVQFRLHFTNYTKYIFLIVLPPSYDKNAPKALIGLLLETRNFVLITSRERLDFMSEIRDSN